MNRSVVPIGRPIDNVKMYVLDAKMNPLPVGVPGELMISSHQVARGYLKRPDENAKTFVDNPYGQGDYARMYRTGVPGLLPPSRTCTKLLNRTITPGPVPNALVGKRNMHGLSSKALRFCWQNAMLITSGSVLLTGSLTCSRSIDRFEVCLSYLK